MQPTANVGPNGSWAIIDRQNSDSGGGGPIHMPTLSFLYDL